MSSSAPVGRNSVPHCGDRLSDDDDDEALGLAYSDNDAKDIHAHDVCDLFESSDNECDGGDRGGSDRSEAIKAFCKLSDKTCECQRRRRRTAQKSSKWPQDDKACHDKVLADGSVDQSHRPTSHIQELARSFAIGITSPSCHS